MTRLLTPLLRNISGTVWHRVDAGDPLCPIRFRNNGVDSGVLIRYISPH
jgi:hypothetical protein